MHQPQQISLNISLYPREEKDVDATNATLVTSSPTSAGQKEAPSRRKRTERPYPTCPALAQPHHLHHPAVKREEHARSTAASGRQPIHSTCALNAYRYLRSIREPGKPQAPKSSSVRGARAKGVAGSDGLRRGRMSTDDLGGKMRAGEGRDERGASTERSYQLYCENRTYTLRGHIGDGYTRRRRMDAKRTGPQYNTATGARTRRDSDGETKQCEELWRSK